MAKVLPKYSAGQVDRAGELIAHRDALGGTELDQALTIVNNWRQSHAHPLNVLAMTLRNRAQKADDQPLISQRLKRLPSIQRKLTRDQTRRIRLTQMQDMGGCRAIVTDIAALGDLTALYKESIAKNPSGRHELLGEPKDYVANPKSDGYRSIHFVFKYASQSKTNAAFNGRRIEVQLRSRLQHAWATAMESVDTITGQALKFAHNSNLGDADWKRFFALMSSVLAFREGQPRVPNLSFSESELTSEVRSLAQRLNVAGILRGFSVLTDNEDLMLGVSAQFLLILDSQQGRVSVRQYEASRLEDAANDLLTIERDSDPSIQAVLVNVDDVQKLRAAYPNYYLDTSVFLEALDSVMQ